MNIKIPIIRIISGFVAISFPSYLTIIKELISKGPKSGPSLTFDASSNMIVQLSQWQLLPLFCYMIGGISILMGVTSLIEIINKSKKESINDSLLNNSLLKLEKENNNCEQKALEFLNLNEIGRNYDFENKYLNDLAQRIQEKVKYLSNHNFLKGDTELKLIVEAIDSEYLFRIHQTYLDIPSYKRGDEKNQNSPYNSVYKQLNLILTGLDEAENRIVNNSIMNQKANEIFLKEKLASLL